MCEKETGCFTCIKITNIVISSLAIITYVIAVPFMIIAVIALGDIVKTGNTSYQSSSLNYTSRFHYNNKELTKEEIEHARVIIIAWTAVLAISLVIAIIGLIGAIKEHGRTMLAISILDFVVLVYYFWSMSFVSAFFKALLLFLSGYYTYLLFKKDKFSAHSAQVTFGHQGVTVPQMGMPMTILSVPPVSGPPISGPSMNGNYYSGQPVANPPSTAPPFAYPQLNDPAKTSPV